MPTDSVSSPVSEQASKSAAPLLQYPNVALERLGTRVTGCSDEFFAPAKRIISPLAPVFVPDKYDDHGKWMDGWETRRRRVSNPDHDWLEVELGSPCVVSGINISTRHFTGNHPARALVEGGSASNESDGWTCILGKSELAANSVNYFEVTEQGPWDRFRLKIYPDGGVARLRIHGLFVHTLKDGDEADLACVLNGARAIAYSDAHFGEPGNMLMPDKGINMGDGWETARRRGQGFDWAIVELGCPGVPSKVTVDTSFFKGNYPDRCDVQAGSVPSGTEAHELIELSGNWRSILPETKLGPDQTHVFDVNEGSPVSHLRLNIHPDGGVSRLRVHGVARP